MPVQNIITMKERQVNKNMNILNKEKLSHPKTKIKEVFRVEDPETSNSMGEFLVTFLPPAKAKN